MCSGPTTYQWVRPQHATPVRECGHSTRITRKLARTGPQIRLCVAHIRPGGEERGLNEWLLGYHAHTYMMLHTMGHN